MVPFIVIGGLALGIGGLFLWLRAPAKCESCGTELPKPGLPGTASHAASGEVTCPGCGKTVDANGKVIGG